jgi:hypothetical protein
MCSLCTTWPSSGSNNDVPGVSKEHLCCVGVDSDFYGLTANRPHIVGLCPAAVWQSIMHKCHVLCHQPPQGITRSWQSICPTHLAFTQPRSVAHAAHALLQRRSRVGIDDRCQPSRLHSTACHARKSKELETSAELSESNIDDGIGPAFRATLDMLEWSRICDHLSAFSSTQCGKRACLSLGIPRTQKESERLLAETR